MLSLKDLFYERSQSLFGIAQDVAMNLSQMYMIDFAKYDSEDMNDDSTRKKSCSSEQHNGSMVSWELMERSVVKL